MLNNNALTQFCTYRNMHMVYLQVSNNYNLKICFKIDYSEQFVLMTININVTLKFSYVTTTALKNCYEPYN